LPHILRDQFLEALSYDKFAAYFIEYDAGQLKAKNILIFSNAV